MRFPLQRLLRASLASALLGAALAPFPAHAAKVMDMQADDLLRASSHVKEMLALTPNQQTLWQQVSARSGAILRARQSRREKMQADLKARLGDPRLELRELDAGIDAEANASAVENRELRALWLTVNDALNDQQRLAVSQFMLSQLERVDAPDHPAGPPPGRGESPQGGKRHQRCGIGRRSASCARCAGVSSATSCEATRARLKAIAALAFAAALAAAAALASSNWGDSPSRRKVSWALRSAPACSNISGSAAWVIANAFCSCASLNPRPCSGPGPPRGGGMSASCPRSPRGPSSALAAAMAGVLAITLVQASASR